MKNSRLEQNGARAPLRKKAAALAAVREPAEAKQKAPLLERWRRLATGLRGVRLFRVTLPVGGGVFWEAECTLNGASVCRRFASELHARAWLSVATQAKVTLSSVERQEMNRPCSSSCFASGG